MSSGPSDISIRRLKILVQEILRSRSADEASAAVRGYPPARVINILISLLYDPDETRFWTVVRLIGETGSRMAEERMESARVVMRRLMWSLNDESGGIGWGAPQAMGEIMAVHPGLADEYARILFSYIHPEGSFIEHPDLQPGVLWGIGRLLHARPDMKADIADCLMPFLESPDPRVRGMAAWAAAALDEPRLNSMRERLRADNASVRFPIRGKPMETTVGALASGRPM